MEDKRNYSEEKFFSGEADHVVDTEWEAMLRSRFGGVPNIIEVIEDNKDLAPLFITLLRKEFHMPEYIVPVIQGNRPDKVKYIYEHWPECFRYEVIDIGWWQPVGMAKSGSIYVCLKRRKDDQMLNYKVNDDGRYASLPDDFDMKTWKVPSRRESLTRSTNFAEEFRLYENLFAEHNGRTILTEKNNTDFNNAKMDFETEVEKVSKGKISN